MSVGFPKTVAPRVSHSKYSPHSASSNSSKQPLKCSYQFKAPVASAPGKQNHNSVLAYPQMLLSLQIWGTVVFSATSVL